MQQARSALTRSNDTAQDKETLSQNSVKHQTTAEAVRLSTGSAQQANARLNALLGAADSDTQQAQRPELVQIAEQWQTEQVALSPQTTAGAAPSEHTESIDSAGSTENSVCALSVSAEKSATLKATVVNDAASANATSETAINATQQFYPVVVSTPAELAAAHKAGAKKILVKGELASKLDKAFGGLRSLSSASLNALALVLSGAALLAPFTGGVSLGAAGTVMGTLGAALTATAIAAISAIGLSLVVAVFKGYDEIKLAGGGVELRLKKHVPKSEQQQQQGTETEVFAAGSVAEAQAKAKDKKDKDKAHGPKTSAAQSRKT